MVTLSPGLREKNKRRTNTRVHIHKATLFLSHGGGNTDIQHNNITLSRMIGHGIGPEYGLGVFHLQIPHLELIPFIAVLFFYLDILKVNLTFRNINLNISTGFEIEMLTFRLILRQFLNKGSHVVV